MLPLFKSHYSLGRSILTLKKAGESAKMKGGPSSIIDIALAESVRPLFLVEDSMSGFMEAFTNCKSAEIPLNFGLRLTVTHDIKQKTEESRASDSKIIIFGRNSEGFKELCKISTLASTEGFYYVPRIDYPTLNRVWTKRLHLSVPFYDSFLFMNSFYIRACIPDFSIIQPSFFVESNDLPFDNIISKKLNQFTNGKYMIVRTKSIYYEQRADFKAFISNRCIHEQTTLAKPEQAHLSSAEFCVEAWKERKNEG